MAIKTSAMMSNSRVPSRATVDWTLMLKGDGASRLWMKSRMAELWAPNSEDMLDEMAVVELV